MDEKTALEELQLIRKLIEETKKSVIYNGKDYIFWGIIVIIGMVLTYTFHMVKVEINSFWIWVVLIPIGWTFSFYNKSKMKEKHPSTYAGKLIGATWGAAGVAMTIIGFIGPSMGAIDGSAISPILCIIMGSAYFISGIIIEVKWLRNLSVGWWLGGILLFYVRSIESLIIMALLMSFFQTIPGIIIYRRYKKSIAVKP